MGKHDQVWHMSACLGDYIGVQGSILYFFVRESGVLRPGEELKGKCITRTLNWVKTLLRERCI